MKEIVVIIAGITAFLANVPYIIDVIKHKSKPNIATWSTWMLLNAIAGTAAYAAHAYNAAVLATANFIGLSITLTLGIRRGTRKYSKFDAFCQSIAIIGLVLWQLFNSPNVALTFALIADLFAIVPTYKHAYYHPAEETWLTYFIAGMSALAISLAATKYTYAALVIPTDIFITNFILVGIILKRSNELKVRHG